VVVAAFAVPTAAARDARFERDPVTGFECGDVLTDLDDVAGALVTEDERLFDDVVADAAVFVVVDVGATDADVSHGDEDLVGVGGWTGTVVKLELVRFD
jgi:hypothetical protein